MKVCFVYPPKQSMGKLFYPSKVWKNYSESAVILPNLGIAYCAAILRDNGHEVDLIEGHALDMELDQIVDRLNSFNPEYVLYTTITDNIQDTLWWIKEIEFYDETFTLNAKRLHSILDLIEEKKLKFLWSARTSVRCVTKEMLARMAKLGCIRLNLGIEVGNEKILKEIRKPITNKMVRDGVRWAKEAGITVLGFFILGLPNETEETIADTINLTLELDLDYVELNVRPCPKLSNI